MDLNGVLMVTRSGTVRAERAAGLADTGTGMGAGTPCTLQTRFQLCSVSKQFAAAAALLLAEAGWPWTIPHRGFPLVGLIVERASGQPYAEFLTERILSPLRLTATTVGGHGRPAWPRVATGLASQCRPSTWTRCRAPATSGRPRPT